MISGGKFPMTVTDEAVDLAMAAMPDRHVRFGRWEPTLARAEVHRMLEAAEPALCAHDHEQIRRQLGGSVERAQLLRHAYEQVDDHPDVLRAFAQLENDLTDILRQTR
jgi:hypothetical protein